MHEITSLLTTIAENTSNSDTLWVAAITAAVAISGSIVTYLLTSRTIKSQERIEEKKLRVNIVSTERLRWLRDLRTRLSEFYAHLDMQYALIKQPLGSATQQSLQATLNQYSSDIMQHVNMLTLMLIDSDQDQLKMKTDLQRVLAFMQVCFSQTTIHAQSFNDQQYSKMKTDIFRYAEAIGAETWRQIKKLE